MHACTVPGGVRLFIDIPLKGSDRYFEVYKPHSLPYYNQEIEEFVSIHMPKGTYFAVSENRQIFSIMTSDDMSKCREGYYTICPADFVLLDYTSQHCLIALFLGNDEIARRNCKRTIEDRNFDPIWIRSPGSTFWVYSLSAPTRITKKCKAPDPSIGYKPSQTMMLEGTGILNDSYECLIFGKNFKLLPHTLGRSNIGLQYHHLIIPAITTLITPEEKEFFQNEYDRSKANDELKNIASQQIDGNRMGLDLVNLKHQAKRLQERSRINNHMLMGLGGTISVSSNFSTLQESVISMFDRRLSRHRKSRPTTQQKRGHSVSGETIPETEDRVQDAAEEEGEARSSVTFVKHLNTV